MPRPPRPPIGLRLARAAKVVGRAFDEALTESGGSRPTWLALLALKSGQAASQRELAEAVGIRGATLTHHLDGMEAAGLIVRRRDAQDRRVQVVEMTAAGDRLFLRLRDAASAFDTRLRHGLTRAEVLELESLLDRLQANVAAHDA